MGFNSVFKGLMDRMIHSYLWNLMQVIEKTENVGLACNACELYLGCSHFELL